MDEDGYLVARLVATTVCAIALVIGGCVSFETRVKYAALQGGADPVRVACADGKPLACAALGAGK